MSPNERAVPSADIPLHLVWLSSHALCHHFVIPSVGTKSKITLRSIWTWSLTRVCFIPCFQRENINVNFKTYHARFLFPLSCIYVFVASPLACSYVLNWFMLRTVYISVNCSCMLCVFVHLSTILTSFPEEVGTLLNVSRYMHLILYLWGRR